jgi:S1-C subfamily serine protease
MHCLAQICLGLVLTFVGATSTFAQDANASLQLYAVYIFQSPTKTPVGTGVYLGNGYVITAAHVIGLSLLEDVRVKFAAQELPAKLVKRGQFHDVDLSLLSVDEHLLPVALQLRRMPVCTNSLWTGEDVIVATPEGLAPSHVMSPSSLPRGLSPKYRTAIADVATTGNSGSGVFDAHRKCLLGIISGVIRSPSKPDSDPRTPRDIAKFFVPSATINNFIPQEVHF